jgi:hypothetical protein
MFCLVSLRSLLMIVCRKTTRFKLSLPPSTYSPGPSKEPIQIPRVASGITLSGRQSKVILTSASFGQNSKIVYSTAEAFYAGVIDGRDVLFLHGSAEGEEEHELALELTGVPNGIASEARQKFRMAYGDRVGFKGSGSVTFISILPKTKGLVTLYDSDTQLILYADTKTVHTFWAPLIPSHHSHHTFEKENPFKFFWGIGTNESILVGGPYLVRDAHIEGDTLKLRGDLNQSVMLTVIAPKSVKRITWNGEEAMLDGLLSSAISSHGAFVGTLKARHADAFNAASASKPRAIPHSASDEPEGIPHSIPVLTGWKYADSLPEIQDRYDDSGWVEADRTTTNIPLKPYYDDGSGRVLYGCDYGL